MSKVSVTPWTPRNSERQAVSPALSIRCLLWRSVHILKYYRVHSFSFSLGEKRGNKSWWQRARASHPILMISWQTLLSTLLENNLFHLKRETVRGQPISMIFLQHFYLWVVLFFFTYSPLFLPRKSLCPCFCLQEKAAEGERIWWQAAAIQHRRRCDPLLTLRSLFLYRDT